MRADPCLCFVSKVGLPTDMNDSTAGEPTDPDDRQVHEVFLKTFLRLFLPMQVITQGCEEKNAHLNQTKGCNTALKTQSLCRAQVDLLCGFDSNFLMSIPIPVVLEFFFPEALTPEPTCIELACRLQDTGRAWVC